IAALGFARLARTPHYIIAIAIAATRFSGPDAPALSPPGLFAKVLEVQGAHRTGEANVEFGDFALGQRVDLYAGKTQALVDPSDVLLVARNAVQRLRKNLIELPALRILHKRLNAPAHQVAPEIA